MHGKLPQNRRDDPSAGKAIGFCFIPFFNLYWFFFTYLRLYDRIDEQRSLHGLPPAGVKPLAVIALIFGIIPYIGILSQIFLFPIFFGILQSKVNDLARIRAAAAFPMQTYR
jgi:hypothetical protein